VGEVDAGIDDADEHVRAGRAHDAAGAERTKEGKARIECGRVECNLTMWAEDDIPRAREVAEEVGPSCRGAERDPAAGVRA